MIPAGMLPFAHSRCNFALQATRANLTRRDNCATPFLYLPSSVRIEDFEIANRGPLKIR
jgi:hypothetical protein